MHIGGLERIFSRIWNLTAPRRQGFSLPASRQQTPKIARRWVKFAIDTSERMDDDL
jgi:hypothetical protein